MQAWLKELKYRGSFAAWHANIRPHKFSHKGYGVMKWQTQIKLENLPFKN